MTKRDSRPDVKPIGHGAASRLDGAGNLSDSWDHVHYSRSDLVDFASGRLPSGAAVEVAEHLESCSTCEAVIADIRERMERWDDVAVNAFRATLLKLESISMGVEGAAGAGAPPIAAAAYAPLLTKVINLAEVRAARSRIAKAALSLPNGYEKIGPLMSAGGGFGPDGNSAAGVVVSGRSGERGRRIDWHYETSINGGAKVEFSSRDLPAGTEVIIFLVGATGETILSEILLLERRTAHATAVEAGVVIEAGALKELLEMPELVSIIYLVSDSVS